jgi:hypothetical protein
LFLPITAVVLTGNEKPHTPIALQPVIDYAYFVLHYRLNSAVVQRTMSRKYFCIPAYFNTLKGTFNFRIVSTAFIALTLALCLASCSQIKSRPELIAVTSTAAAPIDLGLATSESPLVEDIIHVTPIPIVSAEIDSPIADETSSQDLSISVEDIQLFPISTIISGDRVTIQIQPYVPESVTVENVPVEIYIDDQPVVNDTLDQRNWEGNAEGIYEWVWDTSGLVSKHEIRVILDSQDVIQEGDADPTNNEATITFRVGKAMERPLEERNASWITAETDCCYVHAITRTAAYRDFPELLTMVDSAISEASNQLGVFPEEKINLYFIERTIGQGGYAGTEMVIVYNDRPFIGGELYELLVHESVHIIDRQFAPQRTKFLAEGVAVWAAGGHYQKQDLQKRAATLLAMNKFIPLAELANNFYPAQHEIGYLEAGAFVDYLVSEYGWPDVREFYSNTSASDGDTEAEALDVNLRHYFKASLAELEAAWLAELQTYSLNDEDIADLRTTIRYYDTARDYQKIYDPTAYFRTAWLPHPDEVIEFGNAADFLRQPDTETNFTMELMLRSAYDAIAKGDTNRANVLLDSIERFLSQNGTADPLVTSYQDIVHTVVAFGYEPQNVTLDGESAEVLATTASGNRLLNLDLNIQRGDWILLSN